MKQEETSRWDKTSWEQYYAQYYANDPEYPAYYHGYKNGTLTPEQLAYFEQYYLQQQPSQGSQATTNYYNYYYGQGQQQQQQVQSNGHAYAQGQQNGADYNYYNGKGQYQQALQASTATTTSQSRPPRATMRTTGIGNRPTFSNKTLNNTNQVPFRPQPVSSSFVPATTNGTSAAQLAAAAPPLRPPPSNVNVNSRLSFSLSTPAAKQVSPFTNALAKGATPSSSGTAASSSSLPTAALQAAVPSSSQTTTSNEASSSIHTPQEAWPASMTAFVQNIFSSVPDEMVPLVRNELRQLIIEKHQNGTVNTTDWSKVTLPCLRSSTKRDSHRQRSNSRSRSRSRSPRRTNRFNRNNARSGSRDGRSIRSHSSDERSRQEEAKRLSRSKRFSDALLRSQSSTPSSTLSEQTEDPSAVIVGTNQTLLKEYLRLTSAPKPANVRPLEVLQRTMILLRQKWQDEHDYNFLCTQLKSVRQDLTVQLIKNSFTVDVYEFHARIALEKSDIGEFNQCQTQLKSLYQLGIEGSEMEFIAYRILYFLMAKNHSDIMLLMKKLTVDQRNNPFIAHALQVRSELSLGNYGRFFQLVASAPNNGRYILNQFLARERNMALAAICKAYGPTRLPMNFIQSQLGFASLAAAIEFTSKEINMELSDPANYPTCKVAHLKVMEKMRKLGKVDIKGQI